MHISREKEGRLAALWRGVKSRRQQIGVTFVSLTLGLVIVLNVAMVPVSPASNSDRKPIQFSEFQEKVPTPPVRLQ